MRVLRRVIQIGILVAVLWLGIGLVRGWTTSSVEKYCPFGGLATSYSLVSQQHLSCATSELNVSLLAALLLLTLVARKAFCSWICPVGTVSEWLGTVGKRIRHLLGGRRTDGRPGLYTPPSALDRPLRWLRLPVLVVVLLFSFVTAELIFRAYCPYYVMFSMHGHEVQTWSYGILAVILVGAVVIPMAWCRYLCPLGGALWPLSRLGCLRIHRHEESCTGCGVCDAVCPHSLPISSRPEVRSGECTLCLECTHACSVRHALSLKVGGVRPLVSGEHRSAEPSRGHSGAAVQPQVQRSWLVPLALIIFSTLGVVGGGLLAIPSYSQEYDAGPVSQDDLRETTFEIDGVRCVDTARRAAAQLEGLPGVVKFTAYASHRRAVITFDASRTSIDKLRRAIDGPVYDEENKKFYFHVFKVVRIDDQLVD